MTKIKVQDAARQLGAGAKELMDRISGTRKGTQDTLGALRKLEEQLSAKEAQAREEAERVRAEQERIQEEQDRIDAAKAQDEALRAAVLAERARREVDAEIAKYAESAEKSAEDIKKTLSDSDMEYFKELVKTQKAIDLIVNNSVEEEEAKA